MLFPNIFFEIFSKPDQYLDPGSGSFIIQMIIAGIVGAGFFLRGFWSKLFRRGKGSNQEEDEMFDDHEESDLDE